MCHNWHVAARKEEHSLSCRWVVRDVLRCLDGVGESSKTGLALCNNDLFAGDSIVGLRLPSADGLALKRVALLLVGALLVAALLVRALRIASLLAISTLLVGRCLALERSLHRD